MNNLNYKEILSYLGIALVFGFISEVLDNKYLLEYLEKNILTIQLALMALTATIRGLIVAKLQEIKIKFPKFNMKPITNALLFSFKEQIALIIMSIFFVILINSPLIEGSKFISIRFVTEVFIYTCFIYAIDILYDTGKSIFVLVDIIDELNDHPDIKK